MSKQCYSTFVVQQTNPSLCQSRVHSRRLHAAEPFFLKPKRQYFVWRWIDKEKTDKEEEETYRMRFTRISSSSSSGLSMTIRGFTGWSGFATSLFLIPGFVEYHRETFSWCWVIHIPFSKLRQGTTFVLFHVVKHTMVRNQNIKKNKLKISNSIPFDPVRWTVNVYSHVVQVHDISTLRVNSKLLKKKNNIHW